MLSKILNYLRKGGDSNTTTISRKLGIDEGTVEMLLDRLLKLGYIELILQEDIDCSPVKCKGCMKAISCESLLKAKYRLIK
ncbi:MAG: MarR family transcriptional regulator [Candidatus Heimdallarchaeota archaeon]|nr:MarR family transcriptional regulator [Candidatus Heimdallarchaeota archaeon]